MSTFSTKESALPVVTSEDFVAGARSCSQRLSKILTTIPDYKMKDASYNKNQLEVLFTFNLFQ